MTSPSSVEPQVAKASMQAIEIISYGQAGEDAQGRVKQNSSFSVQFNPTSLRLNRSNNVDLSGKTTQTQMRRQAATQSATLSLDLEFDTAEEGTPAVDVRTLTAKVRQFVEPPTTSTGASGAAGTAGGETPTNQAKPGAPPLAAQFRWGPFSFTGIVTQLVEEIDYFARDGTPLRAKVSITITEQNLRFQNSAGAAARPATDATNPSDPSSSARATSEQQPPNTPAPSPAPGSAGTRRPQSVVTAREGESAQQIAARLGGNPAAWRSLMNGLTSPLALPAGTPVQVGPEIQGAGPTLGRATGFQVGSTETRTDVLARVLGLGPGANSSVATAGGDLTASAAGLGARVEAGLALSAASGIEAAAAAVLAAGARAGVQAARSAFTVTADPPARASAAAGEQGPGLPADPRAGTFGRGLPLRARVDPATQADQRSGGRRSIAARAHPLDAPQIAEAVAPPWVALPPSPERSVADALQRSAAARPSTGRFRPSGVYR